MAIAGPGLADVPVLVLHDPARLAAEVERTLRDEIAHHLGYREGGVAGLGL